MAEDRNKNVGTGREEGQQAPGRAQHDDKSHASRQNDREGGQFESDNERNRRDPGYKEGGQEETRR